MIVLGRDPRTGAPVLAQDDEHAIVWGPPRSGKTRRILVPSVLAHAGPTVVASSKRDVIELTAPARARRGPVWVLSLDRLDAPEYARAGWSPVTGCADWQEALLRAHAMVGAISRAASGASANEQFWYTQAERLLAALLHAADASGATVEDVARWVLVADLAEPITLLAKADAAWPAGIVAGIADFDPRIRDSVLATAGEVLRVYDSKLARLQAAFPPFPVQQLLCTTGTLYIVAPADVQALLAPIVVGVIDRIRRAAYARDLTAPVLLALDELANIAPLPDLPALLSEGGSQGVQILGCLQDPTQARRRWGVVADAFPTLFRHKVLLPGVLDVKLLSDLSAALGDDQLPLAGGQVLTVPAWPVHSLASPPPGHAVHVDHAEAAHVALAP